MEFGVGTGFHSQNVAAEQLEEGEIEAGELWKRAVELDGEVEVKLREADSHNWSVAC